MEQERQTLGMVKPDDEGVHHSPYFCAPLKFSKKKKSKCGSVESSCRNE